MLKEKIADLVKNAVVETLAANKDAIKARVAKALADNDLPIPDDLEAPLDALIAAASSHGLDALVASLQALTA